jgi:hypothetical protein
MHLMSIPGFTSGYVKATYDSSGGANGLLE